MTREPMKTYLLTIAQVPVGLALLVLACVQLCCTYIEPRLKRLVVQQATGPKEADNSENGNTSLDDIDSFLIWLLMQEDDCVEWVRQVYEGSQAMRDIVGTHPDRKLYAVLRPTKTENLRRIEWTLRAWPCQYSQWLIEQMKRLAIGFEALRPRPLYKNSDLLIHI